MFALAGPNVAHTDAAETKVVKLQPMRSLPMVSQRAKTDGPAKFVDAAKGNDASDGSEQKPWKTLGHAMLHVAPGETLYLRGGVFYETATFAIKAKADAPITVRSYPGEMAIVDAGLRAFLENPAQAWEPVTGGHADEYRSTATYTHGGNFGNFAESMVPLHRNLTMADLRSTNEFYRDELGNRGDDPIGIYCGPGVIRDPLSGRIHVRLSHTQLAGLGDNAYRGETDPRKVPLVIAGHDYALVVAGATHVRFQDIVFRGAARSTVHVTRDEEDISQDSEHVTFDGCSLYGSGSALRVNHTRNFRLTNCALRGHSAPWLSRFTNKNRAHAGYLAVLEGSDFEVDHCELTDHHDCIQIHGVDGLKLHHNRIDNFDDDGIEPGQKKASGVTLVYQNVITRCLGTFTAHGEPTVVESTPGSGMYVFRNIVDLRRGVYKSPPHAIDPTGAYLNYPSIGVLTDHGSPTQPPYYVYHNTFLMPIGAFRGYYGFAWASHLRGTTRRVFNNVFVQVQGLPGMNFTGATPDDDLIADGNLAWCVEAGPSLAGSDVLAKFRASPLFAASKKRYPPGWCASDVFADPRFLAFDPAAKAEEDFRLEAKSPAIDAGVAIPQEWPDVLREVDAGRPDIGALPLGVGPLRVGIVRPAAK